MPPKISTICAGGTNSSHGKDQGQITTSKKTWKQTKPNGKQRDRDHVKAEASFFISVNKGYLHVSSKGQKSSFYEDGDRKIIFCQSTNVNHMYIPENLKISFISIFQLVICIMILYRSQDFLILFLQEILYPYTIILFFLFF